MIIQYPRVSKTETGFGLDLRLPEGYGRLVKLITPQIKKAIEEKAIRIQKEFSLDDSNGDFPYLNWDNKKGLVGIVVGIGCPCARMINSSSDYYSFHNVEAPNQALALISIISFYLNGLQNLQAERGLPK